MFQHRSAALAFFLLAGGARVDAATVSFAALNTCASVEGLGTVDSRLNIHTSDGGGVVIRATQDACTAFASNDFGPSSLINGHLDPGGGFADVASSRNDFTFTFANGYSPMGFSLRILDFSDYNPTNATAATVKLEAFDALNTSIASQTLSYPGSGSGDATDGAGSLGNFTFSLTADGIAKVALTFTNNGNGDQSRSMDPYIGFDNLDLTFAPEPSTILPVAIVALSALVRRRTLRGSSTSC